MVSKKEKSYMKKLLIALRVVFGAGLLIYVLSLEGGWTIAGDFFGSPWLFLALTVLIFFGAAIESLRMAILLKPQNLFLTFQRGFRLVAVGVLFNFCIPGGTGGDFMKLYYLGVENKKKGLEVATALLVDRAVSFFSLLVLILFLAGLSWPIIQDYAPL